MVSVSLKLIIWFKKLAFSERNSKVGDNLHNLEVGAVWKYITPAFRCILHQSTGSEFRYTGVYISWQRSVLIYNDRPSQESWLQSYCILQERAKPGIVLLQPRAWIWRYLDIYVYTYIESVGEKPWQCTPQIIIF